MTAHTDAVGTEIPLPVRVSMRALSTQARIEVAELRQQVALAIVAISKDTRRQAGMPQLLILRDSCDALVNMPHRISNVVITSSPQITKRTPPIPNAA